MERPLRKLASAALIAVAIALAVPTLAIAQTSPGLGSSQPSTPDVSVNPQFHVYRWDLGGVTYVQINDIAGHPLVAFAAGNGQVLVLPVGSPGNVSVVTPAANAASTNAKVYQTPAITVTQNAGVFSVSNSASTVQTQAICGDPAECTGLMAQPVN